MLTLTYAFKTGPHCTCNIDNLPDNLEKYSFLSALR